MKKLMVLLIVTLVVSLGGVAMSATSVVVDSGSERIAGSNGHLHWIKWVITSTGAEDTIKGSTADTPCKVMTNISGVIVGLRAVCTSGNVPAEDYDVAILDAAGADILDTQGADFKIGLTDANNRRFPVDAINSLMPIALCGDSLDIEVTHWNDGGGESTIQLFYK